MLVPNTIRLQRKPDGTYRLGPAEALRKYPERAAQLKARRDELVGLVDELLALGMLGCDCLNPADNAVICPQCEQSVYVVAVPEGDLTFPQWVKRLGGHVQRNGMDKCQGSKALLTPEHARVSHPTQAALFTGRS
jgi:hypothetical protein